MMTKAKKAPSSAANAPSAEAAQDALAQPAVAAEGGIDLLAGDIGDGVPADAGEFSEFAETGADGEAAQDELAQPAVAAEGGIDLSTDDIGDGVPTDVGEFSGFAETGADGAGGDPLKDALAAAQNLMSDLADEISTLNVENQQLRSEIETLRVAAEKTKGKGKGKAVASAAAAQRTCGPLPDGAPAGQELLDLINLSERVELVFSDGALEIEGLPALLIMGPVWQLAAGRVALRIDELLVHGPAANKSGYSLAGYGLWLDGEQFAYSPRSDVLMIGGGAQMNLKDDVIF